LNLSVNLTAVIVVDHYGPLSLRVLRGPDIARVLGLSPRTVEKHLHGAYAKLGVSGASEAAATAWAAVGVRLPS
jgi:hypothetical protein